MEEDKEEDDLAKNVQENEQQLQHQVRTTKPVLQSHLSLSN